MRLFLDDFFESFSDDLKDEDGVERRSRTDSRPQVFVEVDDLFDKNEDESAYRMLLDLRDEVRFQTSRFHVILTSKLQTRETKMALVHVFFFHFLTIYQFENDSGWAWRMSKACHRLSTIRHPAGSESEKALIYEGMLVLMLLFHYYGHFQEICINNSNFLIRH